MTAADWWHRAERTGGRYLGIGGHRASFAAQEVIRCLLCMRSMSYEYDQIYGLVRHDLQYLYRLRYRLQQVLTAGSGAVER